MARSKFTSSACEMGQPVVGRSPELVHHDRVDVAAEGAAGMARFDGLGG